MYTLFLTALQVTKGYSYRLWALLQTQNFRVSQEKEPCIRVNTRELNREFCTRLSTLYIKILWSMLTISSLP